MLFIGVLLFFAAEIASFVVVAEQIGFLWALVILIVVSALGPFAVRRVGVGVLAHTQERLERGEVPTRELLDGLVVLIGGAMICIPGFIGDALGLLLMIGPVRHLVIRAIGHRLAHRVQKTRIGNPRVVTARSERRATILPPNRGRPGRSVPARGRKADSPPPPGRATRQLEASEAGRRRTAIRVPRPLADNGDSTRTIPPMAATSSATMARPSPDPTTRPGSACAGGRDE